MFISLSISEELYSCVSALFHLMLKTYKWNLILKKNSFRDDEVLEIQSSSYIIAMQQQQEKKYTQQI